MSNTLKHTLLTLLLFFACFGGQEAAAVPGAAATIGGVQQEAGIAQGELYTWPGTLPELVRVFTTQAPTASPLKQHHSPGFGNTTPDLEHWLQQGIGRQLAFGQLAHVSLLGIRIIFPFHYFW